MIYCTDYRFYQTILENSWIFIKRTDILNTKHFQNSIVYYLLFEFFSIFGIFFSILPVYGFKNNLKFLCCFIVRIRDFIKKLYKIMVFFKNNWDIWKPKFQQNFIVYSFFFILLGFLVFCFLFHLSKLVQKLWNFL